MHKLKWSVAHSGDPRSADAGSVADPRRLKPHRVIFTEAEAALKSSSEMLREFMYLKLKDFARLEFSCACRQETGSPIFRLLIYGRVMAIRRASARRTLISRTNMFSHLKEFNHGAEGRS